MTEHARSHLIHASGDDGINAFGIEDEIHCSLDEITHHIAPCAIPAQNRELHEKLVKASLSHTLHALIIPPTRGSRKAMFRTMNPGINLSEPSGRVSTTKTIDRPKGSFYSRKINKLLLDACF